MGLTNLILPHVYVWTPLSPVTEETDAQDILAPGGRFYLVAVEPNKPLAIAERMRTLGLEVEVRSHRQRAAPKLTGQIVLKRRAGREHLSVIRVIKPST